MLYRKLNTLEMHSDRLFKKLPCIKEKKTNMKFNILFQYSKRKKEIIEFYE